MPDDEKNQWFEKMNAMSDGDGWSHDDLKRVDAIIEVIAEEMMAAGAQ